MNKKIDCTTACEAGRQAIAYGLSAAAAPCGMSLQLPSQASPLPTIAGERQRITDSQVFTILLVQNCWLCRARYCSGLAFP